MQVRVLSPIPLYTSLHMKLIDSLLQKPRIIAEALTIHHVDLPPDYWRFRLASWFFRRNVVSHPSALTRNFCPLFWFTNILVPVFVLVAPFVYVGKRILSGFSLVLKHIIEPAATKTIDTINQVRKESFLAKLQKNCDPHNWKECEAWQENIESWENNPPEWFDHYKQMTPTQASTEVVWDSFAKWAKDDLRAFFFFQKHGDDAIKTLERLKEEFARKDEEQANQREKKKSESQDAAEFSKKVNDLVVRYKKIATVVAWVILGPIAVSAAILLLYWVGVFLGWFAGLLWSVPWGSMLYELIKFSWVFGKILAGLIGSMLLFFMITNLMLEPTLLALEKIDDYLEKRWPSETKEREQEPSMMEYIPELKKQGLVKYSFVGLLMAIMGMFCIITRALMLSPFGYLVKALWKILTFIGVCCVFPINFIKMFYTENCPGITITNGTNRPAADRATCESEDA